MKTPSVLTAELPKSKRQAMLEFLASNQMRALPGVCGVVQPLATGISSVHVCAHADKLVVVLGDLHR
jgi:hypothetical protein